MDFSSFRRCFIIISQVAKAQALYSAGRTPCTRPQTTLERRGLLYLTRTLGTGLGSDAGRRGLPTGHVAAERGGIQGPARGAAGVLPPAMAPESTAGHQIHAKGCESDDTVRSITSEGIRVELRSLRAHTRLGVLGVHACVCVGT